MQSNGAPPFRTVARSRAELRVRLSGQPAGQEGWVTTRDVSRDGAFLRCDVPLATGTRLRLTLEGTGAHDALEVEAEVRWSAPESAAERGVGVAFIDPPAAVRRRLDHLETQGELAVLELYEDPEP